MSKTQETRRADSFSGQQHDGQVTDGERVSVSPSDVNVNRLTQAVQSAHRPAYTQAEADRRQREAWQRMERTRQQRQAARFFCKMQSEVRRV